MEIRKHMVGGGIDVIDNAEDLDPEALIARLNEGVVDIVEVIADDDTVVDHWKRRMH